MRKPEIAYAEAREATVIDSARSRGLRRAGSVLLGFLTAAGGTVVFIGVLGALDYAGAGDATALAIGVAALVALGVLPWLAGRRLIARHAFFLAEVLATAVLVWVLALFLTLWTTLLVRLNGWNLSSSFWLLVAVAVVLSAATLLTTRSLLKRPLVSATGTLTICFFALLAGLLVVALPRQPIGDALPTPSTQPTGSPTGTSTDPAVIGHTPGSSQSDVQAAYLGDRAALHDGVVETEKSITVTVGRSYDLEALVCGSASSRCDEPASPGPAVPGPASSRSGTPIKTGARISAWATASDGVRVSPGEAVIQPVLDKSDDASWRWYVTPSLAGEHDLTLHFRILRGETTDQALVPDSLLHVGVTAVAPPTVSPEKNTPVLRTAFGWFTDSITWVVGLLGALSITGPMLVTAGKRLRHRLRRRAAPSANRRT